MNVIEGRIPILYTLINNTSPEVPQRPIYVTVRQSIKTNLNLFLPLCNYGDFRFPYTLDWNINLYKCWAEPKKGPDRGVELLHAAQGQAEKTQNKTMSEKLVSWSRFQPSCMQSRNNHKIATINVN
jgi:hypothetical protein